MLADKDVVHKQKMKTKNLLFCLAAFPILAYAADPLANDAYLKNMPKVVFDSKTECGPMVEQQFRTTPKSLIEAKGEKNVRDRILAGCVYSLGSLKGEEITSKSLGKFPENEPDPLDGVQRMRVSMQQCAQSVIDRKVSASSQFDEMLYCLYLRGSEAGRDFVIASRPSK